MAENHADKSAESVSSPSSPEHLEDLAPRLSEAEASSVVGGLAPKQVYMTVKLETVVVNNPPPG